MYTSFLPMPEWTAGWTIQSSDPTRHTNPRQDHPKHPSQEPAQDLLQDLPQDPVVPCGGTYERNNLSEVSAQLRQSESHRRQQHSDLFVTTIHRGGDAIRTKLFVHESTIFVLIIYLPICQLIDLFNNICSVVACFNSINFQFKCNEAKGGRHDSDRGAIYDIRRVHYKSNEIRNCI